jgi:uncharacterized cupin superfamily protein
LVVSLRTVETLFPLAVPTFGMPVVNESDLDWEEVDREDAAWRRKQLGDAAGNEALGASIFEIPPGKGSFPYHYHTGNEEAMYVLDGTATLRLEDTEHEVEPGDYVAFPADETGAHRLRNEGEEPVRLLMVSTMNEPDVLVYPESDKVGALAGAAPGGDSDQREVSDFFYREDAVGYWDGE